MIVQNNTSAFSVWSGYNTSSGAAKKSMGRLSTGTVGVVDNPAGVGIADRMSSQVSGVDMSIRNIDNGISLTQTADSWMQTTGNLFSRMKSLAIEAGGIASPTDKQNMQTDFKAMQDAIRQINSGPTAAAKFNGLYLTRGGNGVPTSTGGGVQGGAMSLQIGADVNQTLGLDMANLDASNNAIIGTVNSYTYNDQHVLTGSSHQAVTLNDVMTMSVGTPNATGMLEMAINYVSNNRASMGAQQARMESTRSGLLSYSDNLREAEGKINDVDMAQESTELAKSLVLMRGGAAMLGQANNLPSYALSLLGGISA